MSIVSIDPRACIRCASCALVAPSNFACAAGPARVVRGPANAAERQATDAAAALCPTQAITVGAGLEPTAVDTKGQGQLYPELISVAEGVRWKITALPWDTFDATRATAGVREVVRQMAFYEQATFSATQRFMQAFSDDLDFSQWISVWFYEETRHPMVLLKWLERAGETPDTAFVSRGRVSAPFMKSLTGTLVTNVISELVAAEAYLGLARAAPEPLLAAIALRIAADEARHGASFFAYARRALETAAHPARAQLDALKVLHFWLNENQAVAHPVNETMDRLKAGNDSPLKPFVQPNERLAKVIGRLTGLPLEGPGDLPDVLTAQTAQVHAGAQP